jgi:hypothetical protein
MLCKDELAMVYAPRPENMSETAEANVLNYEPTAERPRFIGLFAQAFAILREDKKFRDYQRWQFLNGASFMMYGPSLLYMVSREMTDPKRQYLLATTVVQIIPMVVMLLATQMWAPLFDRVHITRFRVHQGMVSVGAQFMLFCGAMYGLYATRPRAWPSSPLARSWSASPMAPVTSPGASATTTFAPPTRPAPTWASM